MKQMIFAYDSKGVTTTSTEWYGCNYVLVPSIFAKNEAYDASEHTRLAGKRCLDFA
jgi:hypothetical protein